MDSLYIVEFQAFVSDNVLFVKLKYVYYSGLYPCASYKKHSFLLRVGCVWRCVVCAPYIVFQA